MRKNELFIDYIDTDYILSCIINAKNSSNQFYVIYDEYICGSNIKITLYELFRLVCRVLDVNVIFVLKYPFKLPHMNINLYKLFYIRGDIVKNML